MSRFGNFSLPTNVESMPISEHNRFIVFLCDGKIVKVPRAGNEPKYRYDQRVSFTLGRTMNSGSDIKELALFSRIYVNKEEGRTQIQEDTNKEIIVPYYDQETEERYKELKALPSYEYKPTK